MKVSAAFATVLLLASLAAAQDLDSSAPDQTQSVAGAARATRQQQQDDAAKQADIRHLLAITGAGALANQSMDEVEKTIRPLLLNSLPAGEYRDKLVDLFFEKFRLKRSGDQLVELIVPVYDKYYSDDEIKQMIQFYQTPLGQKMLSVLPKISAESQEAGQKWGEELGRECMLEVLVEHPELRQAMQDAKRSQTLQQQTP